MLRIWHDSEEDARRFMESSVFSSVRLSATRSGAPRPARPDPLLRLPGDLRLDAAGKLPCLVRFSHPTALSLKNCESVHNPKTRGFGWSPLLLSSPLDLLRLQSAVSSGSFFCPDAAATSAATSGQSPPHTTATSTSPLWENAHQTSSVEQSCEISERVKKSRRFEGVLLLQIG